MSRTDAEIEEIANNLTEEQLIAVYKLSGQMEKIAESDPLALYTPNEIQDKFHRSDAIIKFMFGGNMSGKSYACCKETACHALEYDPSGTTPDRYYGKHPLHKNEPKIIWFCSVKLQKAKAMWEQTLRPMFPKGSIRRYDNYNDRVYLMNGNIIQLMSYESDIRMWQSDPVDAICLDEQPPHLHFKEARSRVNRKSGVIFCAMTPLYAHSAWTFREIWQKADSSEDIEYWLMDLDHNIHLTEGQKNAQKRAFTGTEEEDSRLHGRFTILKGIIHPLFDDEKHIVKPFVIPKRWKEEYSFSRVIDMHPRNPNVCMWFMYRVAGNAEMWLIEEFDLAGGDVRGFANGVHRMTKMIDVPISVNIIDTPDAEMSQVKENNLRADLAKYGIAGPKGQRSHGAGVQRFNEYLRFKKFKVFSHCKKSIESIKYHMWDNYKLMQQDTRDPKETWIHKDDHWVRNCHFQAMFMPPLNMDRVAVDTADNPQQYMHYHGYKAG